MLRRLSTEPEMKVRKHVVTSADAELRRTLKAQVAARLRAARKGLSRGQCPPGQLGTVADGLPTPAVYRPHTT